MHNQTNRCVYIFYIKTMKASTSSWNVNDYNTVERLYSNWNSKSHWNTHDNKCLFVGLLRLRRENMDRNSPHFSRWMQDIFVCFFFEMDIQQENTRAHFNLWFHLALFTTFQNIFSSSPHSDIKGHTNGTQNPIQWSISFKFTTHFNGFSISIIQLNGVLCT